MTRFTVRTFLARAKQHLQQASSREGKTAFVVGNESADLDSITCAIVYGYIQSSTVTAVRNNSYVIPVTNIPAADLSLRPELTALLKHADMRPSDLITLDDLPILSLPAEKTSWTLVDHNALTGLLATHYTPSITGVIDHHDDENTIPSSAQPRIISKSGSCNSLVTNHCRDTWQTISDTSSSIGAALGQESYRVIDDAHYTNVWDAQVAKLALGSILVDTSNLKAEDKVTEHDRKAVKFLEAKINISRLGKDYDRDTFFNELSEAKADLDGLSLEDILRKDYKQWSEGDINLGVSSVVKPISYLQHKSEDLVPSMLKFAKERELGLFAVMTAFTNEDGGFARQLLVLSTSDGKATQAAKRFAESAAEELKLKDSDEQVKQADGVVWMQIWNQGNVAASRKRVGPLLREAMR